MAGGRGTRWKDYHNTTKHLIKINNNESLLERLVRQLKENNITNISITSNNPLYKIEGIKNNKMIYKTKILNMFYYKALDHEITFLYGDTYYPDSVLKRIIDRKTDDILFFGNTESIVAIKVTNFEKFKKNVDELKDLNAGRIGWAMFRHINKLETDRYQDCDNFVLIKDKVYNINSPNDYRILKEETK